MMQRKVVDGVPYIVVSRYVDRNVEQRIRQMTTFRRGNLGQAVTHLLRKGLSEMDSISPEERQTDFHKILDDLGRIVVLIPEDLDHAVRLRAVLWGAPIYRVFSAVLQKGLEKDICQLLKGAQGYGATGAGCCDTGDAAISSGSGRK